MHLLDLTGSFTVCITLCPFPTLRKISRAGTELPKVLLNTESLIELKAILCLAVTDHI
jgi:hypothetical protein